MKKLSCKELDPSTDCDFTAEGETNEEVVQAIFAHAEEAHPEKVASMSEAEKGEMASKMNELLNVQA